MRRRLASAWLLLMISGCPPKGPRGFQEPPEDGVEITCPVTQARCPKSWETPSAVYLEKTYYFCDREAWERFAADPGRFADAP